MDISYRTLCDPPAPTTAVKCKLPFSSEICIATASETKLQIYTFRDQHLQLIWEKNFWAKIIAIFRHQNGDYDSLILVCDVSKIVVLQPRGGVDLQETEFHLFEADVNESRCIRYPTLAVIDPNDTCIALLIGGEVLYFLTLNQVDSFDVNKRPKVADGQHSKWETINGAVSFNLANDYNPPIHRVRDIKFLEGYNRPTLAIMYEPIPTWSVRLPIHKSTIAVSITSPLLIEREGSNIKDQSLSWTSRPLPHNSLTIVPIWVPHGGFLVLSKNAIIYMTHTSGLAFGLNQLAYLDDECPFELCDQASEPCEIFSTAYTILDSNHVLITVDQHKPAILTLHSNGIDITGMSLFVDNFEFHPSLFMLYKDNLIFGGSTIEDSILFELTYEYIEQEPSYIDTIALTDSQSKLYQLLYDSMPINAPRQIITSAKFSILSKIYQLGTVCCASPFINIHETAVQSHEDAISMALGCGFKKSGCLQYLRAAFTPNYRHEIHLADVTAAFASNKYKFVLFSTQNSTLVYQDFKDDTDSRRGIISTNEPTIVARDYIDGFVQITPTSVKLLDDSNVLFTWNPPNNKDIRQAAILGNFIAVLVDQQVLVCDEIEFGNTLSFAQVVIPVMAQTNKSPQIYKIAIYGDYLFMLQTNNTLHVYSLSNHEVICVFDQFRYFHDLFLKDSELISSFTQTSLVLDMNVIDIGTMAILTLIMKEGNIILYQFCPASATNDYAFKRIKTRKFTFSGRPNKYNSIVQFNDINGITGGFICGDRPMFLIGESGYPRLIPAPVGLYFTQFHTDFIFGDRQIVKLANFDNMKILETHIIGGCVIQRLHLGQTPRCMTFAAPWNSLVLFASYPTKFSHENEPDIDEEAKLTPHYQREPTPPREIEDTGLPIAYEEQYNLYVAAESGINNVLTLERHEVGYCVSFIHTSDNYQNPKSNLSEYLAIGTGFMCHEERMVRGRLAIYKGTLVQSEQQDVNEYKLQELFNKVMNAPVTNICEVDGYIGAFVGSQLQMIMFINEQDYKVASFLNGHFFSNQLLSMKNYLFYVDAFKGFQLIRWRKYGNKLITMAKDFQTFTPLSASLITNEGVFGGIVYDCAGNCQIFEIDEYAIPADSFVVRSVFHIGCRAISSGMFPIKKQVEGGTNDISGYFGWFVGDHGKIGIFAPIKSDMERRKLCVIQNAFEKTLDGLSHQEYRWGKFPLLKNAELISQSPRLVVDLDLLLDLLESQPDLQKTCTKALGRSISDVTPSISELYAIASIFE
ncbi:CPSF A subunit region family protein [Tritrichomonas foetus]|uniref:CPSF A subunit region family protein n=1 Tax=Tritrichomonas foetus TaxID=1144522 RepID=A0A1J4KLQ4_9EUKA|nr:CPSF A subunit region family protein [Tritrichomonas foetus]|eukprot:OHT12239.1 CPSF A subunit region family protein [Tritrichomonas foetus]